MNENEQVLKPCPNCGEKVYFYNDRTIICKKCGLTFIVTLPLPSRLEVIEIWNRRVEKEEQDNDGE